MSWEEMLIPLEGRLAPLGFSLTESRTGGPMGSAIWRFSSEVVDLEVQSDRGKPAIVLGPKGRHLYGFMPWAMLLHSSMSSAASFEEQVEFAISNIRAISQAIENDANIDNSLRELNWTIVKEHLGLDPNMPRPGAK